MAGDWLAIRLDLYDDPAVVIISSRLGIDPDAVVGKLTRLWSWANKHLKDGIAKGITTNWIDQHVSATGFAAAMIESGWLQERSGCVHFPKFDVWNSKSAKQRLLAARRKHKERVSSDCHADVTKMSRSQRDKNVTRGEERRGEERKEVGRLEVKDNIPPARPPAFASQAEEIAIAYQRRRYSTPDPRAKYFPVLVQEAEDALNAGEDREKAYQALLVAIEGKERPQDSSFSDLAKSCGLKKQKAKVRREPSPYKDYTAERLASATVR